MENVGVDSSLIELIETKDLSPIFINIWDDFYEDDCVPDGEKQKTFVYVENDYLSEEKEKECLDFLLKYINENLNVSGINIGLKHYDSRVEYPHINEKENPVFMKEHPNFHFSRWEIKIEHLTHERLYEWIGHLEQVILYFDGRPLVIYSES